MRWYNVEQTKIQACNYDSSLNHISKKNSFKKMKLLKTKLDGASNKGTVLIKGFNEINECVGILYKIKPFNDICMLGNK